MQEEIDRWRQRALEAEAELEAARAALAGALTAAAPPRTPHEVGAWVARVWRRVIVPRTPEGARMDSCPFCLRIRRREVALEAPLAVALPDGFPLNPGHTLVVPRRHVASYFELTQEEQAELWGLVARMKAQLDERHHAAGYNVGINVGEVAGQTVGHAHVHLIPRHPGDVPDPRGGVRWVIPERAAYWKMGK